MFDLKKLARQILLSTVVACGGLAFSITADTLFKQTAEANEISSNMKQKGVLIRHGSKCNQRSGWENDLNENTVSGASVQCFIPNGKERKSKDYLKYFNPARRNDNHYCVAGIPGIIVAGGSLELKKVPGSRTQLKNDHHCELSGSDFKKIKGKFTYN